MNRPNFRTTNSRPFAAMLFQAVSMGLNPMDVSNTMNNPTNRGKGPKKYTSNMEQRLQLAGRNYIRQNKKKTV